METRFRPGDVVPRSGVYRVLHSAHRPPHENSLTSGQIFPKCKTCGDDVRFALVLAVNEEAEAPSLLLVDEEPAVTYTLKRVLEYDGYKVSTADNCSKALALLRGGDYDVVITEMRLGKGEGGLDLARKALGLKSAPVVILSTANPTAESLRAALGLRINYLVVKPIDLSELKLALSRMVSRRAVAMAAHV